MWQFRTRSVHLTFNLSKKQQQQRINRKKNILEMVTTDTVYILVMPERNNQRQNGKYFQVEKSYVIKPLVESQYYLVTHLPFTIHHSHIFCGMAYGWSCLFCCTWIILKHSISFHSTITAEEFHVDYYHYYHSNSKKSKIHWMSWIETEWMVFHKIYSLSIFYNSMEIFYYYHNNIDAGTF